MAGKSILLLEAFYGGSHKQLIDVIQTLFPKNSVIYTMTAKKWHWRNVTSALHFAEVIPKEHKFEVLFTSSVLPLADLLAIRPDLVNLYKIVYFHENQLVYPVRERKERYFKHGYNDILTCLAADKVLFNSCFNMDSFLKNLPTFFSIMPDYKPKNLVGKISPKCNVLHFPIKIQCPNEPFLERMQIGTKRKLHIVWPHRWEHDKDPQTFFSVMYQLKDSGADFRLSVVGETFSQNPSIFDEAKVYLKDNVAHWGYQEPKDRFHEILTSADVAVSTAIHEFFGVSMLEATVFNCYPLCPNRLAYPEIYPAECLYNTPNQLLKKLKSFCKYPDAARKNVPKVDVSIYSWENLKTRYRDIFQKGLSPDEEK